MSLFSAYYGFTRAQYLRTTGNLASYTDPGDFQKFLFTSANYGNGNWYYESIIQSDGTNTVFSALFDSSGTQVTNSEISSTSSTGSLQRSAAITLVDGEEYHPRLRSSTTITTDWGIPLPRLIFDANYSSGPAPIESHIQLWSDYDFAWGSWGLYYSPYADDFLVNTDTFTFDASTWEASTAFYHEAQLYADSGFTAKAAVHYNQASPTLIAASEITTTSTTPARLRSSAFAPIDGQVHFLSTSSTGANSSQLAYCDHSKIIAIVPTASKFELHHPLSAGSENSNHTSYVKYVASRLRYNEATWTEAYVSGVYLEAIIAAAAGVTGSQALSYWTAPTTDAGTLANTEISLTGATGPVRGTNLKSLLFGLDFSAILQARWKVSSAATTDFLSGGKLVYLYNNTWDISLDTDTTGFDISLFDTGAPADLTASVFDAISITEAYQIPPSVTLNSPADLAVLTTSLPTFLFTGLDSNNDDIQYQIQIIQVITADPASIFPTETFETGSTPWSFDSATQWGLASLSLNSSSQVAGVDSIAVGATGEGAHYLLNEFAANASEIYVRLKIKMPASFSFPVDGYIGLFTITDGSDANQTAINIEDYGTYKLTVNGGGFSYTPVGDIPADTVTELQFHLKKNTSTGRIRVWIANTNEASPTYDSGAINSGTAVMRRFRVGQPYTPDAHSTFYIDDIGVSDVFIQETGETTVIDSTSGVDGGFQLV